MRERRGLSRGRSLLGGVCTKTTPQTASPSTPTKIAVDVSCIRDNLYSCTCQTAIDQTTASWTGPECGNVPGMTCCADPGFPTSTTASTQCHCFEGWAWKCDQGCSCEWVEISSTHDNAGAYISDALAQAECNESVDNYVCCYFPGSPGCDCDPGYVGVCPTTEVQSCATPATARLTRATNSTAALPAMIKAGATTRASIQTAMAKETPIRA